VESPTSLRSCIRLLLIRSLLVEKSANQHLFLESLKLKLEDQEHSLVRYPNRSVTQPYTQELPRAKDENPADDKKASSIYRVLLKVLLLTRLERRPTIASASNGEETRETGTEIGGMGVGGATVGGRGQEAGSTTSEVSGVVGGKADDGGEES
jgi:hypothetical protein